MNLNFFFTFLFFYLLAFLYTGKSSRNFIEEGVKYSRDNSNFGELLSSIELNEAKAKQEHEKKLKIHNEAKVRLRLKIARMEAIRRGRKAYARWLSKQKLVEEMEKLGFPEPCPTKQPGTFLGLLS